MIRIYLTFVIFLIGCSQSRQIEEKTDNKIIVVNYKFASRSEIALAIRNINRCGPKLIGINALFIERRDSSDYILAEEIRSAGNVILATNINYMEDSLIRSNEYFTSKCLAEGVVNFGLEDGVVTAYKPYTVFDWSFPITVVSFFDPERAREIITNTVPNEFYRIPKKDKRFLTMEIQETPDMDCSLIRDKIVILGFLGPERVDFLITRRDRDEGTYTHKTTILANIISDLLTNNPEK